MTLQISSEYKGDKTAFLAFFKTILKGSRVRENSFQTMINNHTDFVSVFNDFDKVKSQLTDSTHKFEYYFYDNLKERLSW